MTIFDTTPELITVGGSHSLYVCALQQMPGCWYTVLPLCLLDLDKRGNELSFPTTLHSHSSIQSQFNAPSPFTAADTGRFALQPCTYVHRDIHVYIFLGLTHPTMRSFDPMSKFQEVRIWVGVLFLLILMQNDRKPQLCLGCVINML